MSPEDRALDAGELTSALDQLPVGIWLTDARGCIVWANKALCEQLGVDQPHIVGRRPGSLPALRACDLSETESKVSVASPGHGTSRLLRCITRQLPGEGTALHSIGCLIDQPYPDRQLQSRRPGAEAPSVDLRAGVLTHTAVMRELDSQVSRSRRYHNTLAIVLLRISAGADEGEEPDSAAREAAQVAVGRLLNDKLRWVDFAGQWDESEFLLVLPETNAGAAHRLVGKLVGEMGRLAASITAVAGIAQWRQGDDAMRMVGRARLALEAEVMTAGGAH
jgi:GGDEF domain-containing protein